MLDTRKIWTVAVACTALAAVAPARALADARNEVRAVTFDEDAASGVTRVHVRGAQTPTFTVYKLERPSRVVIDLPQAQLADALRGHEGATTMSSNTWAVSTIAAQQLDDGGAVVRVIVTLARPGRYDVKTDGNEVVVMVQARDPVPKTASPEALEAAQHEAEQAKQQAERLRVAAEAAQHAADEAKQQIAQASKAEVDRAKAEATAADRRAHDAQDAARQATQTAVDAQAQADRARDAAEHAKQAALAEAARAKQEAGASKAEAEVARQQATAAQQQVSAAQQQATAAKQQLNAAEQQAAQTRAEAEQARDDAARDKAAKATAEQARAEAERQLAQTKADAKAAAEAAAQQQQAIRAEAEQAKGDAAAARHDAEATRAAAAADRKQADADRQKAELLMHDAKQQLGTIDQKIAAAQAMEDKARAAHAAAEAREESAREAVERAQRDRVAAETAAAQAAAAAKQAAQQRDQTSSEAKAERDRLAAEARTAADRVAQAAKAAGDAEARRAAAEAAASGAQHDLENTRGQLASVEEQRTRAEQAASDAARKRSDAETAARAAASRRDEAETAATQAAKRRDEAIAAAQAAAQQRGQAEAQRVIAERERAAAEEAAHAAQAAKDAAERQRAIAEAAAGNATQTRDKAEASLAELTERRQQAERAAAELEARSKAAAKAQAEVAAAEARKASDAELVKARAEATRLAADRAHAEADLADRRKAVASQQAETDQLKVAAADARAAADREETRRAQLARQRADEEQALARVEQQKQDAEAAAKTAAAKAAAAKAAALAATPAPTTPAAPVSPATLTTTTTPQTPPARKPTGPKASVGSIAFDGDAGAGRVSIDFVGEADVRIGETAPGMIELVIDNADLAKKLERKLDVTSYGSPVRSVATFRDRRNPARVRLLAELSSPVTPTIEKTGHGVVWVLGAAGAVAKATAPTAPSSHARTQEVPTPVVGGFGATSTPIAQQSVAQLAPQGSRRRIYHGATVDFDFKDAPIHDLLRTIAEVGHVNIVIPDSITAKVTVRLKRVPWDQALEVVLSSYGLWYRLDGNLYRIAPRKELDAEDEAEAARRAARVAAEVPRPEVLPLNYVSAVEVKPKLESLLSPKGKIEVEERDNALIINDVAGNREQIIQLATRLDTQTPQISIEARIVEADSDFKRQVGIQWGGSVLSGQQWGNATGLLFPSSVQLVGANVDSTTNGTGVASPPDFAVNIPAAVGTGEGGAIGLSLGNLANTLDINLKLSALEDTSSVRIISAPKVTVLNNIEAKISQGVSIPISVVSAAGTQTQFVQADLSLTVQAHVSARDCAIAMKLIVTNNVPNFTQTGARGDPTIDRKEARTTMMVQDGETAVLGGIYTRNSGVQYKKIPWFADLPIIGYLFKNTSENDDRTEVLVFITPKITNKASLRCQ